MPGKRKDRVRSHRIKPALCPRCGTMLDGATNLTGRTEPHPGDLTICVYCATTLAFNPDLTLREASQTELEVMRRADPEGFAQHQKAKRAVVMLGLKTSQQSGSA